MALPFQDKGQQKRDEAEIERLLEKYGDDALAVLDERRQDKMLSDRSRNHWKRLHRKMRFHSIFKK